mgnify:CR=1 FL=1
MSWELVAKGGSLDLINLSQYENQIEEGQKQWLRLELRAPVPQELVNELQRRLDDYGVKDALVTTGSPVLNIYFRKGFPWLAIIAVLVLTLAIMLVSWALFKDLGAPLTSLLILAGLATIGIVGLVYLDRRQGNK